MRRQRLRSAAVPAVGYLLSSTGTGALQWNGTMGYISIGLVLCTGCYFGHHQRVRGVLR